MLFATANIPSGIPQYWEVIACFSSQGSDKPVDAAQVRLLMENLQLLNKEAFCNDIELTKELLGIEVKQLPQPLGVILLSAKDTCRLCGAKLLTRNDRPSRVILYTEHLATVPATHYHKFCRNQRR